MVCIAYCWRRGRGGWWWRWVRAPKQSTKPTPQRALKATRVIRGLCRHRRIAVGRPESRLVGFEVLLGFELTRLQKILQSSTNRVPKPCKRGVLDRWAVERHVIGSPSRPRRLAHRPQSMNSRRRSAHSGLTGSDPRSHQASSSSSRCRMHSDCRTLGPAC